MKNYEITFWHLIAFFAAESELQALQIGATIENWFIEEDSNNKGANYLIGVCLAYLELSSLSSTNVGGQDELRQLVHSISENIDPDFWCVASLFEREEWKLIRSAARKLQKNAPEWLPPLTSPIKLERVLDFGHYLHASKLRKLKQ